MMSTTVSKREERQRLTEPDEAGIRMGDPEPIENYDLKDAEEEEFAELWAADRGNQGA